MTTNNQIRLYETRTYLKGDNVTGVVESDFYVVSGSRMLVGLRVTSIDPATTVSISVQNAESTDVSYDTLDTLILSAPGASKRVFNDFYNLFKLVATVTGGNATFSVAVAMFDNASTTRIENAQLDVDLDAFTSEPDNVLIVGTEDGTKTGTKHVFVNNIRSKILAASDRVQTITYADFGTKDQRVTQIDYTAPSIGIGPGYTARKLLNYTLVVNKYRRDSIDWSIV